MIEELKVFMDEAVRIGEKYYLFQPIILGAGALAAGAIARMDQKFNQELNSLMDTYGRLCGYQREKVDIANHLIDTRSKP